jgi:hypothetical protein
MLPEDYLIMEIREKDTHWIFFNDEVPLVANCDYCSRHTQLIVKCLCNKVFIIFIINKAYYCSQNCKEKDKFTHERRCDRAGEEEIEKLEELVLNEKSIVGTCGLINIGNTCFMNSGI